MGREVTPGPLSGGTAHPLAQDGQTHHTPRAQPLGQHEGAGKSQDGNDAHPVPFQGMAMALGRAGSGPHLNPESGNAAGMGHRTCSLPHSPCTGGEEAPQSHKSTCTTRK